MTLPSNTPLSAEQRSHTPGPWKTVPSPHGRGYRCVQLGKDDMYTTLELLPADAYLMAAAPDLLALAKLYASECGDCNGTGITDDFEDNVPGDITKGVHRVQSDCHDCADVRAVIAKAEGRR